MSARPPENVQIHTEDGRHIPVDCVFIGYADGIAQWQVIGCYEGVVKVTIDLLPARTAVVLARAGAS